MPFFVFCVYTFILIGRPQDYVSALIPLRLALVFTVLSVLATMARQGRQSQSLIAQKETKLYLFFFFAMIWTIPFAVYRPGAFEFVILQYIVNVAFFVMFLIHVDSVAKFRRIAAVLVLSTCIFTVLGLRNGSFSEGRYVVGGGMYDPNDVAFVEVSLLAFSIWVLVDRFGMVMKMVALMTVLLGAVLTLYTASRGGLLGLVTFLLLFLFLRVPKMKGSFKGVMAVALVVAALSNGDKINIDRYMTLGSIEDDYNFEEFGRKDIWQRGLTLFAEAPLTGVGVSGFGNALGTMRAAENRLAKWQTAHSSYILVLTETGIFGSVSFFLLIGTCLMTFNRLRRMAPVPETDLGVLPGLLLIGFTAQLVSAAFLSQTYSMYFTLAFAASAAMSRLAARVAPANQGQLPQSTPAPPTPFVFATR